MNDAEVSAFGNYWRTIARNEDFIREHGHNFCPDWQGKWHTDLENAYAKVRPFLTSATRRRMFHALPGGLDPFDADNFHEALVHVLNPPERWFGRISVLCSPEYLNLKNAAEQEEQAMAAALSSTAAIGEEVKSIWDNLNETQRAILQALKRETSQTLEETAPLAGYKAATVRRYSSKLQSMNLIRKTPNGFIRLIELPSECDAV